MADDDVTITVRVDNSTGPGITSVTASVRRMGEDAKKSASSFGDLKATLLSLAPAAVPVAAALVPIAAQAGAAGLAVAAFGAAVVPQVKALTDASAAQTKYTAAVSQYGAQSKQAITAQDALARTFAGMPTATAHAAAGFLNLKDGFKSWSDSMSGFTMVPITRSFAVAEAILPKLNPMVQEASLQFSRLVTVAGGAVASPGFDTLSKKVSDFADKSLKSATDQVIHFSRVLSEGQANGPIASFMQYAKTQGPAVKDTLTNIAKAVMQLLQGAAQAGPGMLSLVNAFAKLVASVPTSLIGNLMQAYTAFKLISLAGAGFGAVSGNLTTLTTRVTALRAASTAAGGGVRGLSAAFGTLSTGAKMGVAVAAIAGLVLVLKQMSDIGKAAPPDVDALTTSIGNFGRTGQASGEALRVYGSNLSGLSDAFSTISKGAASNGLVKALDQISSGFGLFGDGTIEAAQKQVDGFDNSLATLVKSGHADTAASALSQMEKQYAKSGKPVSDLTNHLDKYKSALADQTFEQKLAAASMGLFGAQALEVQKKLDGQKQSADGLRQSIQALNDVQRAASGGMIAMEAAIDAAAKSAKDNGRTLDINTEKGRNNRSALDALAAATDSATASARDNGASWDTVSGIYSRGRSQLMKYAEQMGLTEPQAKALADQILKIPSKTVQIQMQAEDAKRGLNDVLAAIKKTPGSKSVTVKALTSSAIAALTTAGYKVTHMKNGSFKVTANTGSASSHLTAVQQQINAIDGRNATATITIGTYYTGGVAPGSGTVRAPGLASGGRVSGPGTGTSDDVPIMASDGEFVVNAAATHKNLALLEAINAGKVRAFASGGKVTASEQQARNSAAGLLSVSYFGKMAGRKTDEFGGAIGSPDSVSSLVDSLNQWRSNIKAATSGLTEKGLLSAISKAGGQLLKQEKALTKVNSALDSARTKLSSLRDAASQLSDSVKSGIMSGGNITKAAGNGNITAQDVVGQLAGSRDNAKALDDALKKLRARGLNSQSLSEIAAAGVDGGGLQTASALLAGSSSQIKQINSLEKQLTASATEAGKVTAGAMYDASIKAADKVVKGLVSQQQKLEKTMDRIAKSLEKAISKAFKGHASGGVAGGVSWINEQGPELVRLPQGSMVYPAGQSQQMAAGGGGSGQPLQITLVLGGEHLGEILIDPLRKSVSSRGGNVQAVLGRR